MCILWELERRRRRQEGGIAGGGLWEWMETESDRQPPTLAVPESRRRHRSAGAVVGLTLSTTPAELYAGISDGLACGGRRIVELFDEAAPIPTHTNTHPIALVPP